VKEKHNMRMNKRQLLMAAGAGAVWAGFPLRAKAAANVLRVDTRVLDVKGKAAKVFGIFGLGEKQGLEMLLGEPFQVSVRNAIDEETLVHWHGLTPPIAMDGVPMLSGPTIAAGQSRDYQFANMKSGTHWMHSHVGLQEQRLLAAPLIVRETAEPLFDEQEHVVMLHDFTFRDPQEILAELKGGGGAHAAHSMAKMDMSKQAGHDMSKMAEGMAMPNDISYDAMLANDRTLDDPEVVKADKGGRFRLRIINGAAATNFWIDLGALEGQLIAVDGHAVSPIKGSRFPVAIAQRADIRLVLPSGSGAWPILFQSEGAALRSGIILAAGKGAVAKLTDQGEAGAALGLDFEARLRAVEEEPNEPVVRTEMVMLTGGGADYLWGLNDSSEMHNVLFRVRQGERIEVMLHNMTSMAHPMHLHGHYFRVVGIGNRRIEGAVRDTVLVPVGESVTIRFDATNPGTWAFHCHHLYHMNSGMMGAIAYSAGA
jgi:FtsP/CotA-like multicopper oxidase with cupredoxin domain